jgi:putative pyruvate formate lyase activating enzyme
MIEPAYKTLGAQKLRAKANQAMAAISCCTLCPRQCKVNRSSGETGFCRTGAKAVVSSFNAHFGEEAPLVGQKGSGTIFFTHCNLLCNFCQNFEISHLGQGSEVTDRHLADIMLRLQAQGCHNINFVTPSHVVPQILAATLLASQDGLSIPLVYNSGGYDKVDTLKLLDGVIDIYMPDFKFWDQTIAEQTCQARDYRQVACKALKEMQRQVGDLKLDGDGLAYRGLLVRHLVLPDDLAGTRDIMHFIANDISKQTYVNIMPQYRPCGLAHETPAIAKSLSPKTYQKAVQAAIEEGITRFDERRPLFFRR